MLDDAQALDLSALLRGIANTLKQRLTLVIEEVPRHGVVVTISVPTWPSIIKVPIRELARSRKRGGRDLIADMGEEYGRCARVCLEERKRDQRKP